MARSRRASSPSCKNESTKVEMRKAELYPMLVPAALRVPWDPSECPISLFSYSIALLPLPPDRDYRPFGLFLRSRLSAEAEAMQVDLHLVKRRIVRAGLVPSGLVAFDAEEIVAAESFQEMWLKILLDREEFQSDLVPLGAGVRDHRTGSSTFYLLLPVVGSVGGGGLGVDWGTIRRCLSSPVFRGSAGFAEKVDARASVALQLKDGPVAVDDVLGSLVYGRRDGAFFFVEGIGSNEKTCRGKILYPEQPRLYVKRLFCMRKLLLNTLKDTAGKAEVRRKAEHFELLPPEFFSLKILGFARDIGSTLSLLPSMMHQLQNLLVAIELKTILSASFSEGSAITATRVLEALTTKQCSECLSLERLAFLGDAFLKYTVAQHVFLTNESLDEGQLTDTLKNTVNNLHLYELALGKNLQVYVHNEQFSVSQFFALGRPCRLVCSDDLETTIHLRKGSDNADGYDVKCSKSHCWLKKKTIADVVEALIGAFLIDVGFKAAIAFLKWIGIAAGFESSDVDSIMQSSKRNLSLIDSTDIYSLEQALSYAFQHKGVLLEALIHPSFNNHSVGSYQRLEFLGDSALDYLTTSYIYSLYPDLDRGNLSILRSIAVNNGAFAQVAIQHRLHLYIIKNCENLTEAIDKFETFVCKPDSDKDFLEEPQGPKVLADVVESCFGAMLLDTGFDLNCVWRIFLNLLAPILSFDSPQINPIRELRELCPACEFKKFPVEGKRLYMVEVKVSVNNNCLLFSATNPNSNIAERMASQKALHQLKLCNKEHLRQKSKGNSLEETLISTTKGEAKLIGLDERSMEKDCVLSCQPVRKQKMDPCIECVPLDASVQLLADGLNSMKIRSPCKALGFQSNLLPNLGKINMKSEVIATNSIKRVDTMPNEEIINVRVTCDAEKVSAKLQLFKMCAVNNLCPPSFACCREGSYYNHGVFRCKVTVKLEGMATTATLECFADPKEDEVCAEEQAAEGALWYLRHEGRFRPH